MVRRVGFRRGWDDSWLKEDVFNVLNVILLVAEYFLGFECSGEV